MKSVLKLNYRKLVVVENSLFFLKLIFMNYFQMFHQIRWLNELLIAFIIYSFKCLISFMLWIAFFQLLFSDKTFIAFLIIAFEFFNGTVSTDHKWGRGDGLYLNDSTDLIYGMWKTSHFSANSFSVKKSYLITYRALEALLLMCFLKELFYNLF